MIERLSDTERAALSKLERGLAIDRTMRDHLASRGFVRSLLGGDKLSDKAKAALKGQQL